MVTDVSDLNLVIMAGGSGTRFWPKSTSRCPKQLLGFGSERDGRQSATLLAQTLLRFDSLVPKNQRIIVTTRTLSDAVAEQVSKEVSILAEPQGRNTAPCVYWAARRIAQRDPKGIMLVMPADHYIPRIDAFCKTVEVAADWARRHDDLVTLGVKPTRPETGYGYLKLGGMLQGQVCRRVEAFVEKPNHERAIEFVESGNYLWNGGMFIWRADVILAAFDRFMPEMKKIWEASQGNVEAAYPQMTATSIDYGVMEKATNVVTFTLDCGWDDLGSWTSLENLASVLNANHAAGVVTGGELLAVESTGNIVDAPGKLVAILGINDLIVVEHGDAILVAQKDRAQDIKLIVEQVKKSRPDLA
jgi:mannose-1-phosphate guanylyltransferase